MWRLTNASRRLSALIASGPKLSTWLLILCVFEIGYVLSANLTLAAKLNEINSGQISHIQLNDDIPFATGFGGEGNRLRVSLQREAKALVLGVSARCKACRASMPHFKALSAKANAANIPVIVVSRDYLSEEGADLFAPLTPKFIREPTQQTYMLLGLAIVPQAMIVEGGKVTAVERGQLDEAKSERLATLLTHDRGARPRPSDDR